MDFSEEGKVQATIQYTYVESGMEEKIKEGTFCFCPYNLEDELLIVEEKEQTFPAEFEYWGNVFLQAEILDTGRCYYPELYLTDDMGNILYEFKTISLTGTQIKDIRVKDVNEDGLTDIYAATYLIGGEVAQRWYFYQTEYGIFKLESKAEDYDEELTRNIWNSLKAGDFSMLTENESLTKAEAERVYKIQKSSDNVEWVWKDINGDGYDDFIWREKEVTFDGLKRIIGIFKGTSDSIECVKWDVNDSTEFYAWTDAEKIVYYTQNNGIYNYKTYECYSFDGGWNREFIYALSIYEIFDKAEMEAIGWSEKHPDMLEEGVYYTKTKVSDILDVLLERQLRKEEFEQEYEELFGRKFDVMK